MFLRAVSLASHWRIQLSLVLLCSGCTTVDADLRKAATLYQEARYEQVEQWTHALSEERYAMSDAERLRFEYLAGASAYRLGQVGPAFHHLLLASLLSKDVPDDTLSVEDRVLLARILQELKQGTRRGQVP